MQEAIFKVPGYKYGLFLTLFELLAFMLFSFSSFNVFSNERRFVFVFCGEPASPLRLRRPLPQN
jgi:hypothetical protein